MKSEEKTPIKLSSSSTSDLEKQYLEKAIKNNQLSYHGCFISDLEFYFENFYQERNTVLLNSGTSAIHLALILAGVQKGDDVLCQSFTYAASAFPIYYIGAEPVFIGSEKVSWNMCPEALEDAIKNKIRTGRKPKAIICVHSYGMPFKIDEIKRVATKYGISLIEDAAEALGSEVNKKRCGSLGDYGILSFNTNKIVTSAGGGLLICKTEKEKSRALLLASQAKSDSYDYHHEHIGFNYKMNNINAALLKAQLSDLSKRIDRKRNLHDTYSEFFEGISGISIQEDYDNVKSNFWLNSIVFEDANLKYNVCKSLDSNTIEYRPLWKPMHLQPIFEDCDYFGDSFSENLYNNGICLPSGASLTDKDLYRVINAISSVI